MTPVEQRLETVGQCVCFRRSVIVRGPIDALGNVDRRSTGHLHGGYVTVAGMPNSPPIYLVLATLAYLYPDVTVCIIGTLVGIRILTSHYR